MKQKRSHHALRPRDPRLYQIAILSTLLTYGVLVVGLPVKLSGAVTILTAALCTQWIAGRLVRLSRFDPKSAWISGLSLCLLLRTPSLSLAALAAVLAIGSKFVLRRQGKHIFNPTNFGLVVVTLAADQAWVSPGQWGHTAWLALLLGGLGVIVVSRTGTADVTFALLVSYAALLFGRALWLGDPLAIPMHRMQSAALFIFAFFMISDPKTTPNSRAGRLLFAALVATGGVAVEWGLYQPNGFLYSLAFCALLVPWIDRLLPGTRFEWPGVRRSTAAATDNPAGNAPAPFTPSTAQPAAAFAAPKSSR